MTIAQGLSMLFVAMTTSTVQAFRFLAGLAIRYNQAQINQESSSRPVKEPDSTIPIPGTGRHGFEASGFQAEVSGENSYSHEGATHFLLGRGSERQ
jgi:hypothetical protein